MDSGIRALSNDFRSGFERDWVGVLAIDKMMPEKTHNEYKRPYDSGMPFHAKVLSATILCGELGVKTDIIGLREGQRHPISRRCTA